MHIEIIGPTSAGKTTLARKMVVAGIKSGMDISLSDDFLLGRLHLSWIKNAFIRRRLVEIVAFSFWLTSSARYKEFSGFVWREGLSSPGSWFYRINRIRNVIRKIGIFEFISQKSGSQRVVLVDNEGILQGIHNLFVHQYSTAHLDKVVRYLELIPLPDIVIYLKQPEDVLVSRTCKRGHARLTGSSPEKVTHFIRQAIAVFDEMVNAPKIHEKLLLVDESWNIQSEVKNSTDIRFHRAIELVHSGLLIS